MEVDVGAGVYQTIFLLSIPIEEWPFKNHVKGCEDGIIPWYHIYLSYLHFFLLDGLLGFGNAAVQTATILRAVKSALLQIDDVKPSTEVD